MLYDHSAAVIVMQYLPPPHIVLRKGLVGGETYPLLAEHMSSFLAETLFKTSALCLSAPEYRAEVAKYSQNSDMCALTEQVVFSDPYGEAEYNRWTSPQLDGDVKELWADSAAKAAVSQLKLKFLSSAQALLHGDLHTGSLMVTRETTWAIDPEFAFYGPIGFDVGAFLANLFLCYFASAGLPGERSGQRAWILKTAAGVWDGFSGKFNDLWSAHMYSEGGPILPGLCTPAVFGLGASEGNHSFTKCQNAVGSGLFLDSLGFAGAKMIRRIVGIAHVEDLDSIQDADVRANCERKALRFGRELLVNAGSFKDMNAVVAAAEKAFNG
jgi:5-methylthioribose kinase